VFFSEQCTALVFLIKSNHQVRLFSSSVFFGLSVVVVSVADKSSIGRHWRNLVSSGHQQSLQGGQ